MLIIALLFLFRCDDENQVYTFEGTISNLDPHGHAVENVSIQFIFYTGDNLLPCNELNTVSKFVKTDSDGNFRLVKSDMTEYQVGYSVHIEQEFYEQEPGWNACAMRRFGGQTRFLDDLSFALSGKAQLIVNKLNPSAQDTLQFLLHTKYQGQDEAISSVGSTWGNANLPLYIRTYMLEHARLDFIAKKANGTSTSFSRDLVVEPKGTTEVTVEY